MTIKRLLIAALLIATLTKTSGQIPDHRQLVMVDTDIGDDIDDAFALALLLKSPEVEVIGITSAWGDTETRTRLLDRFLREAGHPEIPVATGIAKHLPGEAQFTQRAWAERDPPRVHPKAVDQMLALISKHPNEVTLLAIGPLTNVAAALKTDSKTMHMLKRIVIMGGSVRRGYDDLGYTPDHGPDPEYNITIDIPAAQAVFTSGIPLYVVPLDSSQHKMDEVKRSLLFTQSTPLTDAMALLYLQWSRVSGNLTPTMYDAVAAGYIVDPRLCPMEPLHIEVTASGLTKEADGAKNAFVCLNSSQDDYFREFFKRLAR